MIDLYIKVDYNINRKGSRHKRLAHRYWLKITAHGPGGGYFFISLTKIIKNIVININMYNSDMSTTSFTRSVANRPHGFPMVFIICYRTCIFKFFVYICQNMLFRN